MTTPIPTALRLLAQQFEDSEKASHKWGAASNIRMGLLLVLEKVEELQRERPYPSQARSKPSQEPGL